MRGHVLLDDGIRRSTFELRDTRTRGSEFEPEGHVALQQYAEILRLSNLNYQQERLERARSKVRRSTGRMQALVHE
jgi:hypothetical protein